MRRAILFRAAKFFFAFFLEIAPANARAREEMCARSRADDRAIED